MRRANNSNAHNLKKNNSFAVNKNETTTIIQDINIHTKQINDENENDNNEIIDMQKNKNDVNLDEDNLNKTIENKQKDIGVTEKKVNNDNKNNINRTVKDSINICNTRERSQSKNKNRNRSKSNNDKNVNIKKKISELVDKYSSNIKNMTLSQSMSFLLQTKEFSDDMNNHLQYLKTLIEAKRNAISEEYENNYSMYRQILAKILKEKLGLVMNPNNKKPLFLAKLNYDFNKYNKTSLVVDYTTMVQTAKTKGESYYLQKIESLSKIPKSKFCISFATTIQDNLNKTLNTMNF
jgi:hypothetical protein